MRLTGDRLYRSRFRRGFTLVEVMMSLGIATMILGAVMSSVVFLGRHLVRVSYQHEMDSEVRRALFLFQRDARMTEGVGSHSASSVTLLISGGGSVQYVYDSNSGVLSRVADGITVPVLRNVDDFGFQFFTYNSGSNERVARNAMEVKQIQFTYTLQMGSGIVVGSALAGASPRVILRNKFL